MVSYDLNYRPSLWKGSGGRQRAQEVNREIAQYVDLLTGCEEDFTYGLGYEVEGVDENLCALDPTSFKKMIEMVIKDFPNLRAVATTLREAFTASVIRGSAVVFCDGEFHQVQPQDCWVYDRIGGGDSFASGLIF